ncbi:polyketide cyclase/dehydrase/lipid transport protein [Acidovorax sp. 69]|uniref:SRPBCC family protein n=1 Tax=Acidovorax sp. 69 TaxID=2035202 RepID=UPI000C24A97C|nr:SRPBCC family protein [Acidovorax sp. 69]PJI95548.1 polyketide cyclase/dehydrase/lipid transport protein [Acidovorax sp. 69]
MTTFSATVQTRIKASPALAFQHIAPMDPRALFTGYGPLPAVTGTSDQTGAWDAPGQTRTVALSDGSSAQEGLKHYHPAQYFSYTVSNFTGALRWLATGANGAWWFDPQAEGTQTTVRWRHAFHARSQWAAPVLWLLANVLWRGYMRKALRLAKAQIETSSQAPASAALSA